MDLIRERAAHMPERLRDAVRGARTPGEVQQLARRHAVDNGLIPVGAPGSRIPFDPKTMERPAGVAVGAPVEVIRPGYTLPDGTVVSRAMVAAPAVSPDRNLALIDEIRASGKGPDTGQPSALGRTLREKLGGPEAIAQSRAAIARNREEAGLPPLHYPSPNAVRVGATDAERLAHAPRLDGESDLAYQVRTVPENSTAERILNGYSIPGLNAIARDHKVTLSSGWSKARKVEALLQALRHAWRNSQAIQRL